MILRKRQALFFLFILLVFRLGANETKDGYIRMFINEKTGRFDLSFLTDTEKTQYSYLFNKNANTSFFDVNINGTSYRLGESRAFTTRVDRENDEPVVIYDSKSVMIKMNFTPVKTISSPNANGIRITVLINNKSEDDLDVGLRLLIDTSLGEGRKNIPFATENNNINREIIIESSSDERFWVSRGKNVSLMGSIADPLDVTAKRPDYLHFANWKKLSDVPWKASYHEGRSFNKLPYSIGDSAVSYYWEPVALETGNQLTYTVCLTTEDAAWYNPGMYVQPARPATPKPVPVVIEEKPPEIIAEPAVVIPVPEEQNTSSENNMALIEKEAQELSDKTGEEYNVIVLRMLQNVLNRFIAGEISLNELDLLQIDLAVEKYGQIQ